jgi:hypothetical protein
MTSGKLDDPPQLASPHNPRRGINPFVEPTSHNPA